MDIKCMTWRNGILSLFFVSLILFLAFYGAGKSLWLDEAYSVLVAKQNFSEMLASLRHDAHPPLYYLLLSTWTKLFGDGEIALRSLSGMFYAGGVFAVYFLGREIYEERIGLLAAFLYALSPLATGTAHSVRMYALLGFLSALSTLLFAKVFLQDNQSRLIFWGCVVFNALGMFTQIWFSFLLASQLFTYVVLFYPKNRVKFFALQFFSYVPFAISWTPILLVQLKNNATAWIGRPGLADIATVLLGFYGERIAIVFYLTITVLLFLSFNIWSKEQRSKTFESFKLYIRSTSTLIFVLIFAFSILIPFLVGQFKPIFGQTRFTIIALPAFVLILAPLLYKFLNRTVLTVFCVCLLCLVSFAFVRFQNRTEPCSDRNVTARLNEKIEDGDVLIFTSSSRTATDYYLNRFNADKQFAEYTFPRELDQHPGWRNVPKMLENREALETEAENLSAELRNLTAKQRRRIWLFYGFDVDVSDILKNRLDESFVQTRKIDASCAGADNNKQSDTFYTEILLYQSSSDQILETRPADSTLFSANEPR
jgi:hypothetical protein